jgi:ribosomal-protein-alanine N-acetyltransferase
MIRTRKYNTEVSIIAKPFFEANGFKVAKKQTVNLRGTELTNFDGEYYMTNKSSPYIKAHRHTLRLPEQSEARVMSDFAIKNKQYLSSFEPLQPESYYTESYWKEKIAQIRDNFINDKSCCLNIYAKDGELIGMVNFNNIIRGCFHSCFLGFRISEDMQGKGFMTECLQASIAYVFETLNLHRIAANYMPHNKASSKVLEKCGFVQEGIAEDYLYINGKWEKHVLTGLLNKKWRLY